MMRSFHWRWAGSAAAAWLALAVLSALLPPVEARAGCTHPWVKRTGQTVSPVDRALLDLGDHTVIPAADSPQPTDTPSPCAGGACSRIPNPPVSSTVTVPPRAELWVALGGAPFPSNPKSVGLSPDQDRQHPTWFATSIERPPRAHFAG